MTRIVPLVVVQLIVLKPGNRVLDDNIANIMIDTNVAETNAWENMTGKDRAMLAVSDLKKLGNMARHKINKHCLLNSF